jgi:hypothetical protein
MQLPSLMLFLIVTETGRNYNKEKAAYHVIKLVRSSFFWHYISETDEIGLFGVLKLFSGTSQFI